MIHAFPMPGPGCLEPVPLEWAGWAHRPEVQIPILFALLVLLILLILKVPDLLVWNRARKGGTISPEEVQMLMLGTPPVILDLRRAEVFHGPRGHLRGAHSVPVKELAARLESVAGNRDDLVVLVDGSDALSHRVVPFLQARGYTRVRVLRGGMRAWIADQKPVSLTGPRA